ncbi:hypothetical protein GH714_022143 [Hevea brasiliensis]|uniref:Transposase MuDR plant domain-containing protein n=1 Tax=Hevea brasiliensis TaxID=3981 RepID=A0A6A6M575_HEVBR|nr:hypothetical protein GH714_022143 [Hevea brasiliensis]
MGLLCDKKANDISVNVDETVCDIGRAEGNNLVNGANHLEVMSVDPTEVNILVTNTENVDLNIPKANDEANSMRAKQNADNVEPVVENENLNGNVCMDDMAKTEGDIGNHCEATENSLGNDIETDAGGVSHDFGTAASFEGYEFEPAVGAGDGDLNDGDYDMADGDDDVQAVFDEVNVLLQEDHQGNRKHKGRPAGTGEIVKKGGLGDTLRFEVHDLDSEYYSSDELFTKSDLEGEGGIRYPPFIHKRDIRDPNFKIGMAFSNREEFKEAYKAYGIKHRYQIYFPKNDKERVQARCYKECG